MLRVLFVLFASFLIALPEIASAQDEMTFASTREGFFQELTSFLMDTPSKTRQKRSEELLEKFQEKWMSERFSAEEKDEVIFAANFMLKESVQAYPGFYNYLKTLLDLSNTTLPRSSVIAWLRSLEPGVTENMGRNFDDYLEWSSRLFNNNILLEERNDQWKFKSADYAIVFDTAVRLEFKKLDLIYTTGRDSSLIEGTKGTYRVKQAAWMGEGGRIDWRRVNLEDDKVFAEIKGQYKISMEESGYSIDTVLFYNKIYLRRPLLGSLTEKVLSSAPGKRTSYPRFESFVSDYEYDNIFSEIDFSGGIAMQGAKLYGQGSDGEFARLYFYRNDSLQAFVKARSFLIEEDRILATPAAVSLYFRSDSIHHPGLNMKYTDNDKLLVFYRSGKGIANSPFFDSYHKLDLHCDALYWNTQTPEVSFEMIRGLNRKSTAYFESANYFSEVDYYKMQGIDPLHPLERVRSYVEDYNSRIIKVNAFAKYLDIAPEQASAMLLNLAARGFLVYNTEENKVQVKQRLFDYLNARLGEIDYDVIRFTSVTSLQSNALLNLDNFEIVINGVPEISLSDSQRVYIYPSDQKIVVKKNRNFRFSGNVSAGLFDFFAKDCFFEYDTFRLNLPVIDSLSFMVKSDSLNESGQALYVQVKNVIANLGGDILIDQPDNKSGNRQYPQYPVFNSKEESFVFYDYRDIRKGVYKRERFYYQLEPFVIQKLDNFSTDDLKFNGFLVAGSVMPRIDEPLVVMDDYSLGFVNNVPDSGYPVYADKGRFYNEVQLDNNGLTGQGKLEYLTSVSEADDYVFFLDSLHATARKFEVKPVANAAEFPAVRGDSIYQYWMTDTNIMYATMLRKPFDMYNNNSKLVGQIEMTARGMRGVGIFNFENAEINSLQFDFYHHSLSADTSDFRLLTADGESLAILTEDYKTYIDFEDRIGIFKTLGQQSVVEFPFNKYISSMDEMAWLMDERKLEMFNNTSDQVPFMDELNLFDLIDFQFSGSQFVSTHEDQDSLAFYAQKALYDMENYKIEAEGVKIIRVADAAIYPGDGKVAILEDALLETLQNAYIVADTGNKFHTFYDAQVNIFSGMKFEASGSYDYIDKNENPQEINMSVISADSLGNTFALGNVPESSVFFLSPNFLFYGDVRINSGNKHLFFDGGYRPNQECIFGPEQWVDFAARLNPQEILLPVYSDLQSTAGNELHAALFFSEEDGNIYPAFLSQKRRNTDQEIMSSTGLIKFNSNLDEFRIGSLERINLASETGNYMKLSTGNCNLKGEGPVNLGISGGGIHAKTFGQIEHLTIPDSTRLNVTMLLNFPFSPDLLMMMADSMNQSNLQGVNINNNSYEIAFNSLLGKELAAELLNELKLYGNIKKMPDPLLSSITFTNLDLIWNERRSAYYSVGPLGIGSILDRQVNKLLSGYLEIEKRRSGNAVNLYLELSPSRWYFFSFRSNVMQAISSDLQFNDMLAELGSSERIFNVEESDASYEYVISTRRKQVEFKREMEKLFPEKRK